MPESICANKGAQKLLLIVVKPKMSNMRAGVEKAPLWNFQPQPAAVEAVEEYSQPEQRPQRPAKKIIQPAMMEDA
ncbi:MAG: hypothetical protein ACLTJG_09830 [[Clostridium] innocuum]